MAKHKMSKEVFVQFRDFIYEQCGIAFTENKIYLLEDRLSQRLEDKNLSSYEEYLYYLSYDPGRKTELTNLYNSITTNETSFYRDIVQLNAFMDGVLPLVLKNKQDKNPRDKTLKIWSAGCSTGEEPYTLAMMMIDSGLMLKGWSLEIFASDISDRVLNSARKGLYGDYSVRNAPDAARRKFFTQQGENFLVNSDVKRLVKFANINLFDTNQIRAISNMDVIFCRNVIIYFDDEAKRKVIGHYFDKLVDGGFLILGFSESLINLTRAFTPKGINRSVVYQKL